MKRKTKKKALKKGSAFAVFGPDGKVITETVSETEDLAKSKAVSSISALRLEETKEKTERSSGELTWELLEKHGFLLKRVAIQAS